MSAELSGVTGRLEYPTSHLFWARVLGEPSQLSSLQIASLTVRDLTHVGVDPSEHLPLQMATPFGV